MASQARTDPAIVAAIALRHSVDKALSHYTESEVRKIVESELNAKRSA